MAISFKKYVDITSGVGGGSAVRLRDLIGRLFSTNPLIPTKTLIEFENADDVGTYFGTSSNEYLRAVFYFSFISKNITRPKKLGFYRWADAATAPLIYGNPADRLLATFTTISNGSLTLQMGSLTQIMTSIDLTGAASLAAVAALLQTKIRTYSGGGALWTSATVTYDATRKCFNLTGGATGVNTISISATVTGTDLAPLLGWTTGAILSNGVAIESITTVLTESAETSNNFGSFTFIPALSIDQVTEAATWTDAQNVMFQFYPAVLAVDAQSYYDALKNIGGVGITLSATSGEYPEMAPMMVMAATDYTKRNSVQNYMFQQFALTPSVTTTALSNTYDAIRVNYYGRTQQAGQTIDFYQRGTLMGIATDPTDMNVYANEQWLKDAAGARIMELLLSLARVSANAKGRSQILTTLQSTINQALFNGTISVGKTLNNTQKLYITELTGDENAWQQVQTIGYWLDCTIESFVNDSDAVEYKATYTLIYSKDDAIRKVEGTHVLI